jgi:ubiquinone biosynthesis monooxygenase Coq7
MTFAPVTLTDALLGAADTALRTLFAPAYAALPSPKGTGEVSDLSLQEAAHAARLMRVNHVGEVCAQALYTAQALATPDFALRAHFSHACLEETNHLAWTAERLAALGSRPSLLNPLWYAGAFGLGLVAGRMGKAVSLGFVAETEKQVGAHLQSHLNAQAAGLPEADHDSRAIVQQMHLDEIRHAQAASTAGAAELPDAVKALMRAAAKVMTTVAARI